MVMGGDTPPKIQKFDPPKPISYGVLGTQGVYQTVSQVLNFIFIDFGTLGTPWDLNLDLFIINVIMGSGLAGAKFSNFSGVRPRRGEIFNFFWTF